MNNIDNLLVAVDVQHDFIDGALGSQKAQETLEKINKFVWSIKKKETFTKMLATMDTHNEGTYMSTREGRLLPVQHCIYGENGWKSALGDGIVDDDTIIKSSFMSDPSRMRESLAYLIGPTMSYYNKNVFIFGYCTSICVIANALLMRQILDDANIYMVEDLCADISEENHAAGLAVAKANQIQIIDSMGALALINKNND